MRQVQEDLREMQIPGERTVEQLPPIEALGPLRRRGIATAGTSAARAGFTFSRPQPWHDTLLVASDGVGEVLCDGRWLDCARDQAYWAPAGTPHAYHWRSGVWRLAWVTTWPHRFPLRPSARPSPSITASQAEPLTVLVTLYCAEAGGRADLAVLEPLAELVAIVLRRLTSTVPRRLDPLWAAVDQTLDRPWGLQELARVAGMSTGHLREVCTAETGEPPGRHLARRRLQRAATLLVATSDTVERIARAVGYAGPFAFSAAFRRAYGTSPSAYRGAAGDRSVR